MTTKDITEKVQYAYTQGWIHCLKQMEYMQREDLLGVASIRNMQIGVRQCKFYSDRFAEESMADFVEATKPLLVDVKAAISRLSKEIDSAILRQEMSTKNEENCL